MMNPLVSVIVPVYNVEDYLDDCLTSLVNQTFEDIEIICVNDGSTDNSLDIVNKYASEDDRIKVFSKENTGLGATRNYAMDRACGEYILFLDSDDWLDLDAIRILYEKAKADDLDLLLYLVENFDDKQNKFYEDDYYNNIRFPNEFDNEVFSHKDIKEYLFSLAVVAYNKFCRRTLLEKYNIRFPESIFFEDNPFHYEVLLSSKRISIIREHLNLRRRREDSITSHIDDKFFDVIPVSNMVLDVFNKYNLYDEYLNPLLNFKLRYIMMWYDLIGDEYKEAYWKLMNDDFLQIYDDEPKHNQYLDNLYEKRRQFYLNVIESSNSKELDILNLSYQSDAKKNYNLKKIRTEKNQLDKKSRLLNAMKKDIANKNVKLIEDKKVIDEKNRILDEKYNNFELYFAKRKAHLDVRERELMDKRSEFEDMVLEKSKLLDEKQADFDSYVAEKEKYLDARERELMDKRSEFEDLILKRENSLNEKEKRLINREIALENEFSKKNDLLNLREIELLEIAISHHIDSLDIKPKISVILSSGNEKYLKQCLDSLMNQTLKNIEILCIGDEASDNSLEILMGYADNDSRFKVLAQENQDKNVALSKASGEFVMFMDSNEFLESDACDALYMDAKLNNLDMLIFPMDGGCDLNALDDKFTNQAFDYKQLGGDLFSLSPDSCQAVYKRESLDNIQFPQGTSFEGVHFFWDALLSSKRISLISGQSYVHKHQEDDVEEDYDGAEVISLSNAMFDLFKKHDSQNLLYKDLINYRIQSIHQKYDDLNESYKQDFWKLIHDDYSKIKQDNALHEEFMNELDDDNKGFYLHVLQSRSADELDYLEKYDDIV